jgi:hypothetical protein
VAFSVEKCQSEAPVFVQAYLEDILTFAFHIINDEVDDLLGKSEVRRL